MMCANEHYYIYQKCFCVQKAEILTFCPKLSVFPNNNFLFSQKHITTKATHSLKHITYCPTKSNLAFL